MMIHPPMFFPTIQEVLAIQRRLIEEFGGIHGIRDAGALESALLAVEQRVHYEHVNLAVCAATYAYHLTKAHAFWDGNKRIAAAVSEIFIEMNEASLSATNEQIVAFFWKMASGEIIREAAEEQFSEWIVFH